MVAANRNDQSIRTEQLVRAGLSGVLPRTLAPSFWPGHSQREHPVCLFMDGGSQVVDPPMSEMVLEVTCQRGILRKLSSMRPMMSSRVKRKDKTS